MSERGQRGKEAEKAVKDLFTVWNRRMDFAWHRMPDSKASRNLVAAQPADFIVAVSGVTMWLEAKETQHEGRIAKDKVRQLPLLKKFRLARMPGYVLVLHTTLGRWRIVNVDDLDLGLPSWDLSEFELFETAQDALISTGLF